MGRPAYIPDTRPDARPGDVVVIHDGQDASEPSGSLRPPAPETLIATEDEIEAARLTPRCIVHHLLYADVAQLAAPGKTGKTTVLLYEAIHIAIGRPLYGLAVEWPGWTLYVSAEDQRDRLLARFREIRAGLALSPDEWERARRALRIWDVCGRQARLITASDGNIILTSLADQITDAYRDDPPAVVVFDPLVSFGASEQAVNDNEQGIVTAARRIVRELGCCVRLVHHTGKTNARAGTLDQYSGRGGSALADGVRMTTIMQRWTPETGIALPPGCVAGPGAHIAVMARSALSYAPPDLPLIFIRRVGFQYEAYIEPPRPTLEQARGAQADQLERFLAAQLSAGKYHTLTTLDTATGIDMSRADRRTALNELRAAGRVVDRELPSDRRQGGRKTYLHPAACDGGVNSSCAAPGDATPPDSTPPPPIGTEDGGGVAAPSSSPCPEPRRETSAGFGGVGGVEDETSPLEDVPESSKLAALLVAWRDLVGFQPITSAGLIAATVNDMGNVRKNANGDPDPDALALFEALGDIAADRRGGIDARHLGNWIRMHLERRVGGLRITQYSNPDSRTNASKKWVLGADQIPERRRNDPKQPYDPTTTTAEDRVIGSNRVKSAPPENFGFLRDDEEAF